MATIIVGMVIVVVGWWSRDGAVVWGGGVGMGAVVWGGVVWCGDDGGKGGSLSKGGDDVYGNDGDGNGGDSDSFCRWGWRRW